MTNMQKKKKNFGHRRYYSVNVYSLIKAVLTKKKQKKQNNVITIAAVHCVLHQSIRLLTT